MITIIYNQKLMSKQKPNPTSITSKSFNISPQTHPPSINV
jgi:hypothetical protein